MKIAFVVISMFNFIMAIFYQIAGKPQEAIFHLLMAFYFEYSSKNLE